MKSLLTEIPNEWENKFEDCYKNKNFKNCLKKLLPDDINEKHRKEFDNFHKKYKLKENGIQTLFKNNTDPLNLLKWKVEQEKIQLSKNEEESKFYTKEEMLDLVSYFDKFSTYFSGFNTNRKNVYDTKDKIKTSIAYRIIEENLLFFFNNLRCWDTLNKTLTDNDQAKNFWENNIAQVEKLTKQYFGCDLKIFFNLNTFIKTFSQKGINQYNTILGGLPATPEQEKIQGINEIINLTKQHVVSDNKHFPIMRPLYKQILSERTENFIDIINDDWEMVNEIRTFINIFDKNKSLEKIKNIFAKVKNNHNNLSSFKENFYISTDTLKKISVDICGNYNAIQNLWYRDVDDQKQENGRPLNRTMSEKLKKRKYLTYNIVEKLVNEQIKQDEEFLKEEYKKEYGNKFDFSEYFDTKINGYLKEIKKSFEQLPEYLKSDTSVSSFGENKEKEIQKIKTYFDTLLDLIRFTKGFQIKESDLPQDIAIDAMSEFLIEISEWLQEMIEFEVLYNKVRNYVTKKPFSTEKVKLNFNSSTLANGWDISKESSNLTLLFRKNEKYYLGIMEKSNNNIFDLEKEDIKIKAIASNNEGYFEKIQYKMLPDPKKTLPKVFFATKNIAHYKPSKEILDIRNHASHTVGGTPKKGFEKKDFNINDCHKIINFYKKSIKDYPAWKIFNFKFSKTSQYQNINDFYKEIESQGYKIWFEKIKKSYVDQLVEEGELYLFQIYNKDFSPHSKGRENLHTSYWKMLFDPKNLKNVVAKLNGQAEIFFRPASLPNTKPTHPAGQPIAKKRNPSEKSTFKYDLIKDKRYRHNQYLLHLSIDLNFQSDQKSNINKEVQELLKENKDINIIGIDRGEKHLLYYSVINQKGDILEQGSLNTIVSEYKKDNETIEVKTDYHKILDEREKERDVARKSWQTIEKIKDLKAGYLSHVVHKLSKLIIKYNAIVVLEDLNIGFKRGRFKVEKQVYQKFERALIEKLNYLVFKDREYGAAGHYLNAYQLTEKFESFEKLGKQSGILFYTVASYTSKTDPITGYIRNLYHKQFHKDKTKEFFEKFDSIVYNGDCFKFTYSLDKFSANSDELPVKKQWTLCSRVIRSVYSQKDKKHKLIDVNDKLKTLFEEAGILEKNKNLIKKIIQQDNKFIKALLFYFNLIQNIRVTDDTHASGSNDNDFIQSPVDPFYNSNDVNNGTLPDNGDANGAYNIARKGIVIIKKIRKTNNKLPLNGKDFTVSKKDWQDYAQNDDVIKKQKEKWNSISK